MNIVCVVERDLQPVLSNQKPPDTLGNLTVNEALMHGPWSLFNCITLFSLDQDQDDGDRDTVLFELHLLVRRIFCQTVQCCDQCK